MQILNTLSKKALIATMIASTGLPASLASAQFKVEYDTKAKASSAESKAAKETKDEHVIVIQSHDDNAKYEVKLVNGIVKFAEMNGKELDHDRIKVKEDLVLFLSEDGKVLTELKVPGMAQMKKGTDVSFGWTPEAPKPIQGQLTTAGFAAPKVMLGINLSEPSDAVRKQLKLGDTQAIFVERVIDGLPAKKAGLEDYDVIVSIDGSDFANGELLSKVLREKEPGDALKLVVLRGGEKLKLKAELAPYNAQRLGTATINIEVDEDDLAFPQTWTQKDGNNFAFDLDLDFGPELHEKIHKALRESGLSEEQLAIVQGQLHEHLDGLQGKLAQGNRFFFAPGADEEHEHIIELEQDINKRAEEIERRVMENVRKQEFAIIAQDKARAAMRDAQRQVMELRDGRLIVKQAEEMESHLATLEDRLSALEDRLEGQMDRMEEQMERMADLFERLLDRLEDRD
jgi:hypothetical protein